MPHIVLISGSHRLGSETGRVADYLAGRLQQNHGATTDVIKLEGNPLPLWDDRMWDANSDLAKQFAPYGERLEDADGLVVLTPEWAGMAAAGIKNFMLYTDHTMVGHKPALLVTISSTMGGSYPVEEMRGSSYKNNRILYIPEHLIVRHAPKIFQGPTSDGAEDDYMRGRADFALNVLMKYTSALGSVRAGGDVFNEKYPYGM